MTVYVETNFLLEQAFEQEESDACGELVQFAKDGGIRLTLPAFCIA